MDEIREKICRTALQTVAITKERRLRDLEQIRKFHADLDLAAFSTNFIREVLRGYHEHLIAVSALATPFRNQDYVTSNGQVVPAMESDYASWILYVTEYLDEFEFQLTHLFEKSANDAEFLDKLFIAAQNDSFSEDALLSGPLEGVTAFEAKIFLCYCLPIEERKKIFDLLEVRFDLRDVAPSEYVKELNVIAIESTYFCSIVTDGYFYGALRFNARDFVQGSVNGLGIGIDCSTLFQESYESAGFSADLFKSPISTRDVLRGDMPGLHLGVFEKKTFQSFDDLIPGDGIFWEGHVAIFLGLDPNGRLRIIEALGRRYRTVREAIFPRNEMTVKGLIEYDRARRQLYVVRPVKT